MSDGHHQHDPQSVRCAVVTVSDTRTDQTDHSGRRIRELLIAAGHEVVAYDIIPDEPQQIKQRLERVRAADSCAAVLLSGGTGLAARDRTYEVVAELIDKEISGFGELFRQLSYREIGAKALLSRAVAGVCGQIVVYSMPGSPAAVELAVSELILPTLAHTVALVRND